MKRSFALQSVALAMVWICACEEPPVVPSADKRQHAQTSRIEGSVVFTGTARGNVIVFLYEAARPPPPVGTGRPVAFNILPQEKVFGTSTSGAGPFVAPFTFSLVPEGHYVLRGFLDTDLCAGAGGAGCRGPDFVPWYGVTAEPNSGDVGGAAVDAVSLATRIVEIKANAEGHLLPATGVTVSYSQASARIPVDRPAFRAEGNAVMQGSTTQLTLTLKPQAIDTARVRVQPTAFLVSYVDLNNDGVPDDLDANGQADVWPKVIVRKLADEGANLLDENDLDKDGIVDERGVDYPKAGLLDGKPDAVILSAGLNTAPIYAALTNPDSSPRTGAVPLTELTLVVRNVALDVSDPSRPVPLSTLPKGRYAIILLQATGQSWRIPNELAPAVAPALGFTPVESQGFVIEVR